MTGLRDLQTTFVKALFDNTRLPPVDVTSHTTFIPVRRFDVYRNNVFSSLADVLEAYFPVVTRLVGVEFFRAMAREFIKTNPPRSPVLSQYGIGFPSFIKDFGPTKDLPYLHDVACLELMRQRAYHAADHDAMSVTAMASSAQTLKGDLFLEFHPSVGLLMSQYPVVSIWRTNMFDESVRMINVAAGSEAALVVRPQLAVNIVPLPSAAATFVARLMRGQSLRAAAERTEGSHLAGSIAALIEVGAIIGLKHRLNPSFNASESADHDQPNC